MTVGVDWYTNLCDNVVLVNTVGGAGDGEFDH